MYGGQLIQEARLRVGLDHVELAELIGTTQPVIEVERWAHQARPAPADA